MPSDLVIVESPAKAKTLGKYLKDATVESSIGHIRDLPRNIKEVPAAYQNRNGANLGIDIDAGFKPIYLVMENKAAHIARLRRLAQQAKTVWLATDDDREGEAISAGLVEELNLKEGQYKRAVFHEITESAILHAMQSPRDVDWNLVEAQETRRVIDRIYGYEVSSELSRKSKGLATGRVQGVAVKILVQRENARINHVPSTYTTITAVTDSEPAISATSYALNGKRLASGKDFDDQTGELKAGSDVYMLSLEDAQSISRQMRKRPLNVAKISSTPYREGPPAPYTTSTLQQEASRKLKFDPGKTMKMAQMLYEAGFITYMRTDSTNLSEEAQMAARLFATNTYGAQYVPEKARTYSSGKAAQEAHEAIRPSGSTWKGIEETKKLIQAIDASGDAGQLYELIFKRTVASQMTDREGLSQRIDLDFITSEHGVLKLAASGKTTTVPGWTLAYTIGVDEAEDPEDEEEAARGMPDVKIGDDLGVTAAKANARKTKPPARYTQALLVQALENEGIGRPSTYAATMQRILDHEYATKKGQALVPTFKAFYATARTERDFTKFVDLQYTANLEEQLDEIANGKQKRLDSLQHFYDEIQPALQEARSRGSDVEIPHKHVKAAGAQLSIDGKGQGVISRGNVSSLIPKSYSAEDLTVEKIEHLLQNPETPTDISGGKVLGICPHTGGTISLKTGPHGPYLFRSGNSDHPDKTANLPKGTKPESISLETAASILEIKRTLAAGTPQETFIAYGQYGPYASRKINGKPVFKKLTVPKAMTLTLEEANDLFK